MVSSHSILQEAFNILTRYEVAVDREHFDQVDNLRYTFNQLLARALQSQCKLLGDLYLFYS